jgi:hypothetical protein
MAGVVESATGAWVSEPARAPRDKLASDVTDRSVIAIVVAIVSEFVTAVAYPFAPSVKPAGAGSSA